MLYSSHMSTTQDSAFKTNLNAFIEAKGWKPVNLTAALSDLGFDVTDWTVKRWCNGESEPRSSDMYAAIARALGTTPNVLLGFDAGEDAGEDVSDSLDTVHGQTVAAAKA